MEIYKLIEKIMAKICLFINCLNLFELVRKNNDKSFTI